MGWAWGCSEKKNSCTSARYPATPSPPHTLQHQGPDFMRPHRLEVGRQTRRDASRVVPSRPPPVAVSLVAADSHHLSMDHGPWAMAAAVLGRPVPEVARDNKSDQLPVERIPSDMFHYLTFIIMQACRDVPLCSVDNSRLREDRHVVITTTSTATMALLPRLCWWGPRNVRPSSIQSLPTAWR